MNQIQAVLPSIRLFQLCGINPFGIDKKNQPRESQSLKFYSLFHIGLSIVGLGLSFYQRTLNVNGSDIGRTVSFLQLIGIRIAHFIIVCESLLQHKTLKNIFITLCQVDTMMEKAKIEKKVETKNYFALPVLFYVGIQLIVLALLIYQEDYQFLGYWASYLVSFLVSCFRYLQVFNCIWFIWKRYEILNERLAEVHLIDDVSGISSENHSKAGFVQSVNLKLYISDVKNTKRSKPIKNFDHLILLRQMYDKLYTMSMMINYTFGLSNLINIANDFVSITSNSYFVFLTLQISPLEHDHVLKVVNSIVWSLPHFVNIIVISAICHFTIHTVSK